MKNNAKYVRIGRKVFQAFAETLAESERKVESRQKYSITDAIADLMHYSLSRKWEVAGGEYRKLTPTEVKQCLYSAMNHFDVEVGERDEMDPGMCLTCGHQTDFDGICPMEMEH